MTLQNLLSELEPMRSLHPLTPCNVEAVDFNGCCVKLEQDQSDAEFEAEELRESNADLEKQLKASEEENAELTRQLEKADEDMEKSDAWDLKHAKESAETFRQAASAWSVEVKEAREEITAMRKKKGVAVGYIAAQSDILSLLGSLSQYPNEKGYAERAKEILNQIHST